MKNSYYLETLITTLALVSAPLGSALTINNQPLPSPLTLAGHYESASHTLPLKNEYKKWIGELSYSWLNNPTNQSLLHSSIWNSLNSGGDSDGWQSLGSNGNSFTVKSRWEKWYPVWSNSFSFSVPTNNNLAYSLIIHDDDYTEITKWSELGYVPLEDNQGETYYHEYWKTGAGTQLESTSTYGINDVRYNLEAGGIYSVYQNASQDWAQHMAQTSNYSIVIEPVPETSTYALLIGCLALSAALFRRRFKS